jgi:5-methyltetrahydrofolate--homocysteine methyltransferase
MRKSILEKIKTKGILVSDGAWGTLLQERGLQPGQCPESWNLDYPEKVMEVAKAYVEAGSDLIETNSFGGSRFKLRHYGLENKTFEINRKAAEISRAAAGEDVIVLGSIGPTGKMLIMGDVTREELYQAFKEQAIALEHGGADAICIETMTDLDEAIIAVQASRENTGLEVICTMTFDKTVTGEFRTMMGVSPEQMVKGLVNAGANIIGTNCGNGMENMIPIVREIRKLDDNIPVLVHANAGLPHLENGKNIFDESPDITASFVNDLIDSGANIIGGCCGTTPNHIIAIRQKAEGRMQK